MVEIYVSNREYFKNASQGHILNKEELMFLSKNIKIPQYAHAWQRANERGLDWKTFRDRIKDGFAFVDCDKIECYIDDDCRECFIILRDTLIVKTYKDCARTDGRTKQKYALQNKKAKRL